MGSPPKGKFGVFGQTLAELSSIRGNVSLSAFALLLLSEKCLSWPIMRAMNSATCQELTLAASAKLAVVRPGSRNRQWEGSVAPSPLGCTDLHGACTCYGHRNAQAEKSTFHFVRQPCYRVKSRTMESYWVLERYEVKSVKLLNLSCPSECGRLSLALEYSSNEKLESWRMF